MFDDQNCLIKNCKIRASLLNKDIKKFLKGDLSKHHAEEIAIRLQKLPQFSKTSIEQLIKQFNDVKLKHCLNLLAIENSYETWNDLLESVKMSSQSKNMRQVDFTTALYKYGMNEASLNNWYSNYDDAKKCLDKSPNQYLLTYKNHYFTCNSTHITELGLDPKDKDWELIGRDWAKPRDLAAFERLKAKLTLTLQNTN